MPVALGVVAATMLSLTVWFTSSVWNSTDGDPNAALAMADRTTSSATSAAPRSTEPQPPAPSSTATQEPTSSAASPKTTTPPNPTTTVPTTESTTTDEEPPPPKTPEPEQCSAELSGTQPHVAQVGNHLLTEFAVDSVGGAAGRSGASDHPEGLALDFMVDSATGDELADYVLTNQSRFGVTYVIWAQRYNDGAGWSTMEDRGSATANHYDHVHVSFEAGADVSVTC